MCSRFQATIVYSLTLQAKVTDQGRDNNDEGEGYKVSSETVVVCDRGEHYKTLQDNLVLSSGLIM